MTDETQKKFQFNIEEQEEPAIPGVVNIPNYRNPPSSHAFPKLETQPDEKVMKIKNLVGCLKWFLVPLSLMQLLFILPKTYPLIVTMLFPIIGLVGIMRLSAYWINLFGVSLLLLGITQVIVMGMFKGVAYIVVQSFFMLFELFSAYVCFRAARFMNSLNSQGWMDLKSF